MSEETAEVSGRRRFLRTAAIAAAGSVAGTVAGCIAGAAPATAAPATAAPAAAGAAVAPEGEQATRALALTDHAELQQIGGWKIVENGNEKLIVARTDLNTFVACSAICTHKGCEVTYVHDVKLLVCPCHGARFDLEGKVVKGPAKRPLARHKIAAAAVLDVKPVALPE